MTPYVVVEGKRTEPKVLKPSDVLNRLHDALVDIKQFPTFDALLVFVDAEDEPWAERRERFLEVISTSSLRVPAVISVASCCIETWLLGHRGMVRTQSDHEGLRTFLSAYDVRDQDPEGLPRLSGFRNRAATHEAYLKAVFESRGRSYSKTHPGPAAEPAYLDELIRRLNETPHLQSLRHTLTELKSLSQDTPTPAAPPPSPA
ncbi:hypothetical protein L6R46_16020 [Myxococcota bacterium]|nr:hypothetical protein [Myxococcota bacterium]